MQCHFESQFRQRSAPVKSMADPTFPESFETHVKTIKDRHFVVHGKGESLFSDIKPTEKSKRERKRDDEPSVLPSADLVKGITEKDIKIDMKLVCVRRATVLTMYRSLASFMPIYQSIRFSIRV